MATDPAQSTSPTASSPPAWLNRPDQSPPAGWKAERGEATSQTRTAARSETGTQQPDERKETEQQQPLFPGVATEAAGNQGKRARSWYHRALLVLLAIVIVALLVAGGVAWWLYERQYESTDDAFIDGHAVQMAPKIAGYVSRLNVQDNQLVHEGDVLLEIDPRDYQIALERAQAAKVSAEGRLAQAVAQVTAADAQAQASQSDVLAAEATAENADQDLTRNSSLAPRGAVSQQTLDSSVAIARSRTSQLAAARSRASAAESQIKLARSQQLTADAELQEAEVGIRQAQLNLSYTKIVAPISGRITHRTVEQGDYLQPGQPLFAVVDPNVWVTANFKETQLTRMQQGQKVEIRVDAFPGQVLWGHVDSFQRGTGSRFTLLPAENATGNYVKVVQRVPVKIIFDSPPPAEMILGPGMSVEPTVSVRP